jgi:hypothetical protein
VTKYTTCRGHSLKLQLSTKGSDNVGCSKSCLSPLATTAAVRAAPATASGAGRRTNGGAAPPPRQCALSPPPPAGAVRPLPSSSTAFSPPHRGPDLLWLQRGAIPWCGTCGLCVKAALAQCSGGGSGAGAVVVVAQEHEDVVSATAVCGCDCTCFYDCSSVSFSTWRMFGVCRVPGQTLGKAFFAESLFPECMTPSVFRPSPSASGT